MKKVKIAIFGYGNIGKVLSKKLKNYDQVIIGRGDRNWKIKTKDCDFVFICIPSIPGGKESLKYMLTFLKKGVPVITCEKAAIACNWKVLKKYEDLIGYTATVGGGTKMMLKLKKSNLKNDFKVKAVVNGTLNFISDSILNNVEKREIVKTILQRGYAEPGAKKFKDIIGGEAKDMILKTVIFANSLGVYKKLFTPKDIQFVFPTGGNLKKNRCIVSIEKESIRCGYIEDTKSSWLPDGVNNSLLVNGKLVVSGPGAGADATTKTMISDFKLFL